MKEFEGVYPAVASTFKENGDFDFDAYTGLIRHLIKGGCHGVTLFAIAGEYYKLSYEEGVRINAGRC